MKKLLTILIFCLPFLAVSQNYGYALTPQNLPANNIWQVGNQINLTDSAIAVIGQDSVFGYEGQTNQTPNLIIIGNAEAFSAWLKKMQYNPQPTE